MQIVEYISPFKWPLCVFILGIIFFFFFKREISELIRRITKFKDLSFGRYTDSAEGLYRCFETNKSIEFYDTVAKSYDFQQSRDYIHTLNQICMFLTEKIGIKDGMKVLDLGGGTGLVYVPFMAPPILDWYSFDASSGMIARCMDKYSNYQTPPLVQIGSVFKNLRVYGTIQFDLIIISFLFSSLDYLPDFALIVKNLKPGGFLIVADTHPELTKGKEQIFTIMHEDKKYGLRLKPWSPIEIQQRFSENGMRTVEIGGVERNDRPYSYVFLFQKG